MIFKQQFIEHSLLFVSKIDKDFFDVHDDIYIQWLFIIPIKSESLVNDFVTKYLLGIVYCLF